MIVKNNIERRIQILEKESKPRIISTLSDLVMYVALDGNEDSEFSPEIQKLIEEANKA